MNYLNKLWLSLSCRIVRLNNNAVGFVTGLLDAIPVGTRSVLWGAHCFFIHPWFVLAAWWKLYGFPTDYRLWVCFALHDLGYWGKHRMDDAEGERHVEWAARLVSKWFDQESFKEPFGFLIMNIDPDDRWPCGPWGQMCLFHSRYYAKKYGHPISKLCVADKYAITLEPWWFYLPRVVASGEIWEYLEYAQGRVQHDHGNHGDEYARKSQTMRGWQQAMCDYLRAWVAEHREAGEDRWTTRIEG